MSKALSKILLNKRLLAVLFLGFASGLPLALTGSTLQAWFTQSHVDLITIGVLSLVGLPYSLKFLWAPVMDQFSLPWLGKRRGWIVCMQIGLIIALIILANMDPTRDATPMAFLALIVAFFSASQDISINAYQTDILSADERGLGASYYIFTYRLAALLSGGLALVFAANWGWKLTYELMAGLMFITLLITCLAPKPYEVRVASHNIFKTTYNAFLDLMQRDKICFILLFIALYKIGDALGLQLMTNFLLHGLGFTLTEVGLAYKTVSFVGTILGAFIGGLLLVRLPIYRALLLFGFAQAFSNLMFVLLALSGKHYLLMTSSVFIENFCTGLSTSALLAFMMSLCSHRYTATQFALLSAFASIGRVFLGPVAAFIVQNSSWAEFYFWSFILSFPGLLCLWIIKNRVSDHAPATID